MVLHHTPLLPISPEDNLKSPLSKDFGKNKISEFLLVGDRSRFLPVVDEPIANCLFENLDQLEEV